MNTFQLFWRDHGSLSSTARNQVQEDPRPLLVQAKEWMFNGIDGQRLVYINFYNNDDEVFLTLFEIPIMIKQLNAVPQ